MSATSLVSDWRALPGQLDSFIGQVAAAKAIHERLGASVYVAQTVAGGNVGTLVYMMNFDSGAAYGAFSDALGADAEWQKFWADAMSKPTAELVSSSLYSAIDGM